jgi:hypothetical protein
MIPSALFLLVLFAAGCGGPDGETASSSGAPDPGTDAGAQTNDGPDAKTVNAKKTK